MSNNKHKKFSLKRIIVNAVIITGISVSTATLTNPYPNEYIPFTQEDMINNIQFNEELTELLEIKEITFKNKELLEIVSSQIDGEITSEKLRKITALRISNTLTNNDLSDLKYLPNLKSLFIYNNKIDLNDIRYNQDLFNLYLNGCTISNTISIPNSTNSIIIEESVCTDQYFIVPYYSKNVSILETSINNLFFKNPSFLESLSIRGHSFIDIKCLAECINLKELQIEFCANVKNTHVLKDLTKLEKVILDDYASIWLTIDTLNSLPIDEDTKIFLTDEIIKLDELAKQLVPNEEIMTDDEKIKSISLYILDQFDYSDTVAENITSVEDYNYNPIYYALNSDEVICVNYACLFQALANRLNFDVYQLFSESHTWNIIKYQEEYRGYDLTFLDGCPIVQLKDDSLVIISDKTTQELLTEGRENILHYYNFYLDVVNDSDHQAELIPSQIKKMLLNIGYINENSFIKTGQKNDIKLSRLNTFIKCYFILILLSLGMNYASKKIKNKSLKKIKDNQ